MREKSGSQTRNRYLWRSLPRCNSRDREANSFCPLYATAAAALVVRMDPRLVLRKGTFRLKGGKILAPPSSVPQPWHPNSPPPLPLRARLKIPPSFAVDFVAIRSRLGPHNLHLSFHRQL